MDLVLVLLVVVLCVASYVVRSGSIQKNVLLCVLDVGTMVL